jgi:RNA polymerase sigma factor (sigma-70 family)
MPEDQNSIKEEVNHLYRHEYGKLVSVLTKTFGVSNIELAEDVVHDAMLEAIQQWTYKGVPENPLGWIYKVAKYKAVNLIKRDKYKRDYNSEVAHYLQSEWTAEPAIDHIFTDKEIADDQLRMMFTCCHPVVSTDSQIALTLKTLCGFSIPEIARAFLTTEENINKRLVRARKTIRTANVTFEVPIGKDLEPRLNSILETIYLLFNEGYSASTGDTIVRYELCEEAIRLTEIIASNPSVSNSSSVYALLALMSLNASRFKSRIDESDNIIDLAHQDRSKWDSLLIQKGLNYLEFATHQNEISIYHILATISAHHCTSKNFDSTDWESILALYNHLIELDKSPIVLLNRALVVYKTSNAKNGLAALDQIKDQSTLLTYLPYYTTKAELYFKNGETEKAKLLLIDALKLPMQEKIKSLINSKISEYSKK